MPPAEINWTAIITGVTIGGAISWFTHWLRSRDISEQEERRRKEEREQRRRSVQERALDGVEQYLAETLDALALLSLRTLEARADERRELLDAVGGFYRMSWRLELYVRATNDELLAGQLEVFDKMRQSLQQMPEGLREMGFMDDTQWFTGTIGAMTRTAHQMIWRVQQLRRALYAEEPSDEPPPWDPPTWGLGAKQAEDDG